MRSLRVVPSGEPPTASDSDDSPGSDDSAGTPAAVAPSGAEPTPGTGDAIVVEAEDGERFQLTLDEALRGAVGAAEPVATPAPPRRAAGNGTPLTPREIQTRVRAGESPQDLADDSGTSLDKIMRFAYAVVEERARVADEARRARARRDGDGNLVPFGETVDSRFTAASIVAQSVEWDSFRRPDGSWVVSAAWATDGTERRAHWAFSLTTRTVLPLDQVSSDLLSDRPLRPVVRAVPDAGDVDQNAAAELYDQEAPHAGAYSAPPPVGWVRASSSDAAAPANPPLPLRLAEPWSQDSARAGVWDSVGAGSGGDDDRRPASPPVEDTVPTEHDMDGEGVDGIDVGGDSKLDELFDDDFIDDDRSRGSSAAAAVAAPAPPVSGGRSRGSRSQAKVPRWDDILLSTRRRTD